MDFDLSDAEKRIRDTARAFAQEVLAPAAAARDREHVFPADELRQLADLGLLGINVPAAYGGSAAGAVALSLAATELARACAATTVAVTVTNMAAELIVRFGSEQQKQEHAVGITSGRHLVAAFALSEPGAGSDAGSLRTTATRTASGWVLRGEKLWITSGDRAGLTVLWARTRPEPGARALSAFLVRRGCKGFLPGKPEEKMGLRGSTTVAITLDDCEVGDDALLGNEGDGFRIAMTALDGGRIGIASQALGVGEAALAAALGHCWQNGRLETLGPVSATNSVASRASTMFAGGGQDGDASTAFAAGGLGSVAAVLADCASEVHAARLLTLRAASRKQHGLPFTREASMAKVYASEAAWRICNRLIQLCGADGYTAALPLERYLRDVRVTRIYEGTSEVQRMVIARELRRGGSS